MSSINKNKDEGEEESSQNTPQAITITIMDTSSMDGTTFRAAGLGTTTLRPTIVSSSETQDAKEGSQSLLVVSGNDGSTVSVSQSARDLLQTVTETHMGSEELPVISNISSSEDVCDQSTIQIVTKTGNIEIDRVDEAEESEGGAETSSYHCLICNEELQEEQIPVFKTLTTTSQRKVSVYIGILVGQKLTSRKVHSDIICPKCFSLLNRLDLLEIEIRDTKEELVNTYQETVAIHGGRARRRKPAAAKKSDYVFPKIEPDDEDQQAISLEMDETFEPKVDDILDEEHDRREDRDSQDEEWEPEYKRARAKREASETDPRGPPKRKRGRPRKDAAKSKEELENIMKSGDNEEYDEAATSGSSSHPICPVCKTAFSFPSQLRRHVRHEHPDFDARLLPHKSSVVNHRFSGMPSKRKFDAMHMEMDEDMSSEDQPVVYNLSCSWCDKAYSAREAYDKHLKAHRDDSYKLYLNALRDNATEILLDSSSPADNSTTGIEDDVSCNMKSTPGGKISETINCSVVSLSRKTEGEEEESKSKCSFCGSTESSEAALQCHLDTCHGEVARTCMLCNEQSIDAISLREHVVHHYHGVLKCPVCPTRFSMRHHLLSHLSVAHRAGYTVVCSECGLKYENYKNYELHLLNCHNKGAVRICKVCGKRILAFDYYKHVESHEAPATFNIRSLPHVCTICSCRFEYATQLYQHKYHKHLELFAFNCDECERRCRTERMLQLHKWGHKYGSHQCPVCRLKFRQVDQLKRHLLGAHPDQEGYTCKYCPLTLKNYATYIAHLKFKHPKLSGYNRPVKCKVCGETFDHKLQWKYHMRTHTKPLQTCLICGASIKNLDVHMNLHTRARKFECSICGAVYHNKASFQFHVKRVHMGASVRKHLCHICGKGFLTPADQRIHITRVHQGERNYWCTTCNKGYKSKVSLTYHQRLHTGEKPHKCLLCGRGFHVPSYLKRHMEHDHRAQYPGVYFKQGRPKTQEARGQYRCPPQAPSEAEAPPDNTEQSNGSLPEVVQITVPMEMGEEEEVAAVNNVQNDERNLQYTIQEGIVFVVCEKIDPVL